MARNIRTSIFAIGATSMLSLALAGCGSTSATSGTSSHHITLSVMSWNVAADTLQRDAALYEKAHPNVTIHVIIENSPTSTYTKLNAELASGSNVPDIMTIETYIAPSFLNRFPTSFLNVTKDVGSLKPKFAAEKWASLTSNGKIYGIPWDVGPSMIFYRRDMFKAADVNPSTIQTWQQFIQAGQKIENHYHGQVKLTTWGSGSTGLYREMLYEQNTYWFNKKGQIAITSPASIRAVDVLREMYKDGLLSVVPYANGWNDTIQAFTNNQIATAPDGIWYVGTIEQSAPSQSGKWGVFPLPAFTPNGSHAANLGGSNLLISASTPHPKTAVSFAEFCMTNTQALNNSMHYGIFPSYLPYYSNPIIQKPLPFFDNQKVFELAAEEAKEIPVVNHTSNWETAHPIIENALQEAVLNGVPAATAMRQAAQKISQQTGQSIAP
ncbi:hypothetical protein BXT84_10510 [Sulfobacillus thermotolerans]|uniref:ABC transporter substrate-binding protein n=1 Tax=Sulfobacillus thermotolerans TaxID=338644 RepID=A0ABM6RSP0_9FIRM|nr:hypothetical protein BXT84_10510 [Sulfobacillus thermotolerans]